MIINVLSIGTNNEVAATKKNTSKFPGINFIWFLKRSKMIAIKIGYENPKSLYIRSESKLPMSLNNTRKIKPIKPHTYINWNRAKGIFN